MDLLLTMIRTHNYVGTGQKLGVSDNAIRKHLKKQGINPSLVKHTNIRLVGVEPTTETL